MQATEEVTHADRQLDRVRKALTVNPSAIVMILPDEAHRELAQAAFEKQHKNAVAAKGTMLALTKREDPTLDEIIESLSHLQQMAVNARPAEHQLDNTPIGRAIEEEQQRNGKKQRGRGGEPQQVGEILKGTDINWAETVPEPRPKIGDRLRVPSGQTTSIECVYGYQADLRVGDLVGAFEIGDTTGWRGFVFAHSGEWRLVNAKDDYTDEQAAELKNQAGDVIDGQTEVPSAASVLTSSNDTPPEGFNWPAGDLAVDPAEDEAEVGELLDDRDEIEIDGTPLVADDAQVDASAAPAQAKGGKKRLTHTPRSAKKGTKTSSKKR